MPNEDEVATVQWLLCCKAKRNIKTQRRSRISYRALLGATPNLICSMFPGTVTKHHRPTGTIILQWSCFRLQDRVQNWTDGGAVCVILDCILCQRHINALWSVCIIAKEEKLDDVCDLLCRTFRSLQVWPTVHTLYLNANIEFLKGQCMRVGKIEFLNVNVSGGVRLLLLVRSILPNFFRKWGSSLSNFKISNVFLVHRLPELCFVREVP